MTAAAASPSYAPRPTSRPKGRWWPVPAAAMRALDAIRPMGVGGRQKVFGLSESQIARRVKAVARPSVSPVGRATAVTPGASAWPAAWPRTARPPMRSSARAAGSRAAAWSAVIPAANRLGQRPVTCSHLSCIIHRKSYCRIWPVKLTKCRLRDTAVGSKFLLQSLIEPPEASFGKFDCSLLPICVPRIDIALVAGCVALRRGKRISLKRVHQFVQRYPISHCARNKLSPMHTDIVWPFSLPRSFFDVRGCRVVPSWFMLHSDGSAEDTDVVRVGKPAHEYDVSVFYATRSPRISNSPVTSSPFKLLHRFS